MKTRIRLPALTFLASLLICAKAALSASDFVTYKNAEYGFSFSFPGDWKRETPGSSIGIVKISSRHGYGKESCNLTVRRSPSLRGTSTQKAVKTITPSMLIAELKRGGVTDATVAESGLTKVFNRDAFYAVLSYSIHTMGEIIPVKSLQAITTKRDIVYTFTCGTADPGNAPRAFSIFRVIIGTLHIDP